MKRTANKGERAGNPDLEKVVRWVERVAVFWSEQSGLPPITGRIVGWLMICDSPEQSAGEIAAAIGASRASLTTSMRLLIAIGLVHSVTRPGRRTVYYRIDGDAWEMVLRRRIASMASFRAITREGLALLGENKPRAARIQAADQVYAWAESVFANAPPCPSTKPKMTS
jgi:DNA-binding transcriptional regulator GbsR (MarR family)